MRCVRLKPQVCVTANFEGTMMCMWVSDLCAIKGVPKCFTYVPFPTLLPVPCSVTRCFAHRRYFTLNINKCP